MSIILKHFPLWIRYKKITLQLKIATLIHYFRYYFNSLILKKEAENRHDHFVPQFLLKNFAFSRNKNTCLLYAYKRNGKSPFSTSTKNIANQIGFYNSKNKYTKKKDDYVDKIIYKMALEDNASKIIKKILDKKSLNINFLEESILASFVAHLYTKTPSFRGQLKNFLLYIIENKKIELSQLDDKEFFRRILEDNILNISQKELIKYNYSNNKLSDVEGAESFMILASIIIAEKIVKEIYYKKIHLLEAKNKDFFITSDNPVIVLNFKEVPVFPMGWDLKDEKLAVCLPISPSLCLIYDMVGVTKDIREIDDKLLALLKLINYNIMFYANRLVFSSEKSQIVQNCFNAIQRQFRYK